MTAARLAYDVLQGLLLVAVLGGSCIYLLGQVAPSAMAAQRLRLSSWLGRPSRPAWIRRLAPRLAPQAATTAGCHGCSQRNGCTTASTTATQTPAE
ncbi:MAG: DUF6587 family protein [Porticoccaceae bacterium]